MIHKVVFIVMKILSNAKLSILLDICFTRVIRLYAMQQTKRIYQLISNKNETRQSFPYIIKTIFPSFCIPSTLKSLFKKQKCKKCLFEFINVPMAKKHWCWYNIKQYYPESICFKYWWQRKGIRMFDKMRKAKKVEIQNRTVIPVLICCFLVFLNHYPFKYSAYNIRIFTFSTSINGYVGPILVSQQVIWKDLAGVLVIFRLSMLYNLKLQIFVSFSNL